MTLKFFFKIIINMISFIKKNFFFKCEVFSPTNFDELFIRRFEILKTSCLEFSLQRPILKMLLKKDQNLSLILCFVALRPTSLKTGLGIQFLTDYMAYSGN